MKFLASAGLLCLFLKGLAEAILFFEPQYPEFCYLSTNLKDVSIHATKLELIKIISDIQSEDLLKKIWQFLNDQEPIKKTSALTKEETELLLKINDGLPEEIQLRYKDLLTKLSKESISEKEHEELLKLIPVIEAKNAERFQYLFQLAQLWHLSVDEVMDRLGITPPSTIHA